MYSTEKAPRNHTLLSESSSAHPTNISLYPTSPTASCWSWAALPLLCLSTVTSHHQLEHHHSFGSGAGTANKPFHRCFSWCLGGARYQSHGAHRLTRVSAR